MGAIAVKKPVVLIPVLVCAAVVFLPASWFPWQVGDGLPDAVSGNHFTSENAASFLSIFASQMESGSTILQTFTFALCVAVGYVFKDKIFPEVKLGIRESLALSLFGISVFFGCYFSYWLRIALSTQIGVLGPDTDVLFIRKFLVDQAWSTLSATFFFLTLLYLYASKSTPRHQR